MPENGCCPGRLWRPHHAGFVVEVGLLPSKGALQAVLKVLADPGEYRSGCEAVDSHGLNRGRSEEKHITNGGKKLC